MIPLVPPVRAEHPIPSWLVEGLEEPDNEEHE
jgi:hypothetical protein